MAFPSSIPSYAGFTSSHTLSQDNHASQHNSEQADITAIATKVGTGASTPTNNTVLRGNGTGTTNYDTVHLSTDVQGVLGISNGGTGQSTLTSLPLISPVITSGGSWAGSPTITTPTIADFTNAIHTHATNAQGGQLGFSALLSTIFSGQIQSQANSGTGGGTIYYINLGGIKLCWGIGMVSNSGAWQTIDWSVVGFTVIPIVTGNSIAQGSASGGWVEFTSKSLGGSGSPEIAGCSFLTRIANGTNTNASTINFIAIGT